ncbi:MAG TPA: hypothetical protein VN420_05150 [Candidatus Fimivivens sp.]|nr:hypothetical protein [Candidatus Fimivivens sp.]
MYSIRLLALLTLLLNAIPAFAGDWSVNGKIASGFLSWDMVHVNDRSYEPTLQGSVTYQSGPFSVGAWESVVPDSRSAANELDAYVGIKPTKWLDVTLLYMDIGPDLGDSANWFTVWTSASGNWGSAAHRYAFRSSNASPVGFQDVRYDTPQWKTDIGNLKMAASYHWCHDNGPKYRGAQIIWSAPKELCFAVEGLNIIPSVLLYRTWGDIEDRGVVFSVEIQ